MVECCMVVVGIYMPPLRILLSIRCVGGIYYCLYVFIVGSGQEMIHSFFFEDVGRRGRLQLECALTYLYLATLCNSNPISHLKVNI